MAQLQDGCYPFNLELYGQPSYGYVPSLAAGIVFCSLFGIAMALHVFQTTWKQLWWTYVFAIGSLSRQ
jgi:hypothetical protein